MGLCGDLKFGRTVHSLIKALSRYSNNKIILISPDELKIPDYIKMEVLKNTSMEIHEVKSLEEVIDNLDILYMTRIQKERFDSEDEYLRLKDSYILTKEKLRNAKDDMLILHPLPRVNEIHPDVDLDKRATYFKQARYGMYVRMALISKLLGVI
ncbi:Aspartate carbamoyltransferase [bioreactor metagenome]|uniref:aspartate carbamoyltransferase n=1 Tax=bioreactor metagenome TaxID=1076179 RepID=A0A645FQ09_9ZZZZ